MIDRLLFALTLSSALGCGLMAGFFLAFSACVMNALARLPTAQGIAAMQSINVVVLNRLFFAVFFGTGATCVLDAGFALAMWREPDVAYLLVGSLLYLGGTILVTIVFNVPLNEALAGVEPESADGARLWTRYLTTWTAWNHVRASAALAAAVSLTIALIARRAGHLAAAL
ncbi:MAG TPA: anthrone oxygenase family protein [Terrimicrobiaceae bacterium]